MQSMTYENSEGDRATTQIVGSLDEFEPDSMKMTKVGSQTLVVVRTSDGVFALDNACPHQGYGLATGALGTDAAGEPAITCQWHNWKFRVSDGVCTLGEEDVACHPVSVDSHGSISVSVTTPTPDEERTRLWPSLRRGIEAQYSGQIARDSIRLLENEAAPADIMWEGVKLGAAKNDYGPGHEIALAADCLHLAELWTGDDRALALVQGLSGIAEQSRGYPARSVPEPDPTVDFADAVENEQYTDAMAWVAAAIERGDEPSALRHHFVKSVSNHHIGYGHGAIYVQKMFELLERAGWDRALDLLPHLVLPVSGGTREDTLPYMRKAMEAVEGVDLESLANSPDRRDTGWDPNILTKQLLAAEAAPIDLAVRAILDGAGVEGLLDSVTLAVSERLLRYDLDVEADREANFGWLDITHGMTYARAARWAWQNDPGPHTARLALFTAWLAFDTGRAERRHGVARAPEPDGAVAAALTGDIDEVADSLARAAMDDRGGSFIVVAHLVKTVQAAREEAEFTGSSLPLAAAARFVHAPRRERFVARSVAESLDFVKTGRPPRR